MNLDQRNYHKSTFNLMNYFFLFWDKNIPNRQTMIIVQYDWILELLNTFCLKKSRKTLYTTTIKSIFWTLLKPIILSLKIRKFSFKSFVSKLIFISKLSKILKFLRTFSLKGFVCFFYIMGSNTISTIGYGNRLCS